MKKPKLPLKVEYPVDCNPYLRDKHGRLGWDELEYVKVAVEFFGPALKVLRHFWDKGNATLLQPDEYDAIERALAIAKKIDVPSKSK